MRLNPDLREKLGKFRRNRRSFYSLIALGVLLVVTIPAELLFNDRPLVMSIDGEWFFPVFKDYTYQDFGGDLNSPVASYRDEYFQRLLNGERPVINSEALYGSGKAEYLPSGMPVLDTAASPATSPVVTYVQDREVDAWAIWPLVEHSFKSTSSSEKLPVQRLASPVDTQVDGETVPGASTAGHFLGTDEYGKDVLARLVYGFRLSLIFGVATALSGTFVGCVIGGIQGFFGGLTDLMGQRAMEIWGAIPQLLLLMVLMDSLAAEGGMSLWGNVLVMFFVVNLTSWMGMAHHMRAQFLRARNQDYVRSAKALGVSDRMIMVRHILPNSLVPIITFLPFTVSGAILALVGLDFLGFGLSYPAPSLGEMLAQGQKHLHAWWILIPAFTVLAGMMILLTFVGDGIRNAFDPRYKG